MNITDINVFEHRHYVPIKGWDGVEAAFNDYNDGKISGSRATERQLVNDSSPNAGAFMVLGLAIATQQKGNFVTRLLEEAKSGVDEYGFWRDSYDYDALGTPFFKSTVEIIRLDKQDDIYGISINAAHVGNEPEKNLAAYLDVERGISECIIVLDVAPASADDFRFDFEPLLRKLDAVLPTRKIAGKAVAKAMMPRQMWQEGSFTLAKVNGFSIVLKPTHVGSHITRVDGKLVKQWSAKGSVLTGKRERDYESKDETAKDTPRLRLTIKKDSDSRNGDIVWKKDEQAALLDLGETIAAALR